MKKNIVGIPSPIKAENNKQILLCNTNRKLDDYLTSIKCRKDGKYSKIPNYLIEKSGVVHKLNTEDVTDVYLTGYHKENVSVIVICLENRGWLTRRTKDGMYVDWLGDIYSNKVFEKKWRGKQFWDIYTKEQTESTNTLIGELCKANDIPREFVGHNVLIEGVENFNGVVSRSNYNEYWTDLSPSFKFELL
jgi:hypothetical protein|tara:strand:+ start:1687 stop:2259 length:573 start_codon:yes stop_codon:yes gene_type:complete